MFAFIKIKANLKKMHSTEELDIDAATIFTLHRYDSFYQRLYNDTNYWKEKLKRDFPELNDCHQIIARQEYLQMLKHKTKMFSLFKDDLFMTYIWANDDQTKIAYVAYITKKLNLNGSVLKLVPLN